MKGEKKAEKYSWDKSSQFKVIEHPLDGQDYGDKPHVETPALLEEEPQKKDKKDKKSKKDQKGKEAEVYPSGELYREEMARTQSKEDKKYEKMMMKREKTGIKTFDDEDIESRSYDYDYGRWMYYPDIS